MFNDLLAMSSGGGGYNSLPIKIQFTHATNANTIQCIITNFNTAESIVSSTITTTSYGRVFDTTITINSFNKLRCIGEGTLKTINLQFFDANNIKMMDFNMPITSSPDLSYPYNTTSNVPIYIREN